MAVNVLGNAWLQITPRWVGLDRMGSQLQQQIRVPMGRVGDSIREATSQATRLGGSLDDASDATRRAAVEAAQLRTRIADAGDEAEETAGDVEDIGDAAQDAAGEADKLADSLADAGDAAAAGAEQAESRWKTGLKGIGVAAGAAFAGVAVAAGAGLASALDIEPVIDKMNAGIGAAGPLAADLGKVAGDLYAGAYGESMGQVTEAIEAVWKSGAVMEDVTNSQLQSITATALDLAGVMGEEVGPVMQAVGTMVRTGLAKNATEAFDIIARGLQEGANISGDFLDAITGNASNLQQFGFTGAQATGLVVQGLRAGADSADEVLGLFEELVGNLAAGGEDIDEMFKTLGLDAKQMNADFAAGGPAAIDATDRFLDALRELEDPLERNAIAAGLFGEEGATVLGVISAIDPSSAVAGLGNLEGAAGRLGTTLNDNAKTNLIAFKREVEMALVTGLGGALGALKEASGWLATNFGPALDTAKAKIGEFFAAGTGKTLLSGIGDVLGDLADLGSGFLDKAMPGLRSYGDYITGSLWPALKNLGAIALRLWEDLRPAVALVGGVLLGAFSALGWVVANVLGPALRGITGFVRDNQTTITALAVAVGVGVAVFGGYTLAVTAASWATYLWASRTVIMGAVMRGVQGAMAAMRAAVLLLNAAFWANPIGIVIAALVALAAGFAYLWTRSESFRNFWKTVWEGIKTATLAVVDALVAAYKWVVGALEWVGQKAAAFFGFYVGIWRSGFNLVSGLIMGWVGVVRGIFETAFGAIKAFFEVWWAAVSTVFRVAFDVIRGIISFFVNIFKGDWEGAWNAIKNTTDRVLGIVRGAVDTVLGAIRGAFETAVTGIGKAWDGVKRVAAVPVNFVIDFVYNKGIRKAFNLIAGLIGVGQLAEAPLIPLARGGRLAGYGGGDRIPALLEAGETVVDKDRTRMLAPIFAAAGVPGFKLGGLLGRAWDATGGRVVSGAADLAGNVVEFARGALADGLSAALGPVRAGIGATLKGDGWRDWLRKLALSPLDKLVEWVRGKDEAATAAEVGSAGGGVQRWAGVAADVLRETGQSLRWLPTLLRRMNQESGGSPNVVNKWDINWQRGHPSVGLMQVIGPTFRAHAGPYRNTGPFLYGTSTDPRANIYASTMYTLSRYGSLAAWNRPGGYDNGGPLHPGWTLAYNGTGRDEWVMPPGSRPGGGVVVHSTVSVDARGSSDPAAVQRAVEAGVARGTAEMAGQLTVLLRAGAGAA